MRQVVMRDSQGQPCLTVSTDAWDTRSDERGADAPPAVAIVIDNPDHAVTIYLEPGQAINLAEALAAAYQELWRSPIGDPDQPSLW